MNEETVVAVYDTAAQADAAVRDLKAANVPAESIGQHTKTGSLSGASQTGMAPKHEGFWASVFGSAPSDDTTVYERSIDSGSTVVTVKVPSEHFGRISAILEKHNPIDLDERAAGYGVEPTTATRTNAAPITGARGTPTDGGTLQLSEESLTVGKRAVSGGTTRIRRYVVETPVEENVTLHSEKVTMDRRPVTDGRPLGQADFSDKSIEMTETDEEAVVGKTVRVKEEVSLRKEGSDRVETVRDTVRHDEVKVEQVPGGRTDTNRPANPAQRRA